MLCMNKLKINHHPSFEHQEEDDDKAAAPHWPALVSALGAQLPPAAATALLSEAAAPAPAPAPLVLQQTLQVSRPRRMHMAFVVLVLLLGPLWLWLLKPNVAHITTTPNRRCWARPSPRRPRAGRRASTGS